jgi:Uma2 family endonuclease
MVMPDTARRYTVDEVLAFPDDGNRYELVDGELLVTPAPSLGHQAVAGQLYAQLLAYLKGYKHLAQVLFSPADITWSNERLVQPDVFVVPRSEVSRHWTSIHTLLLAVEVVSPSSARSDRLVKRRLYQRQGVATYWVVDPDARLVEVWHPEDDRPEIVTDAVRWRVAPEAEELAIALAEVFEDLPA